MKQFDAHLRPLLLVPPQHHFAEAATAQDFQPRVCTQQGWRRTRISAIAVHCAEVVADSEEE